MRYLKVIITKYPLFLVLLGGFLLRLIGLNQSLWLDEATTARVAQQYNYSQILTQFSPHDFHPPLYYLFMKFWTGMFGYSEVALRMPSVLASLVTGWIVYLIVHKARLPAGRSIKSVKSIAIWAAAFFLFNPLIIYYSQEARMYSVITLLVTLIFWSVMKFKDKSEKLKVTTKNFKLILFANVFIALALGTYYGSVFFIAVLYGYLLLKKEFKLFIYLLPGTLVAGFFLYPLFLTQLKNSGEVLRAIPNWSATLGKANLKNLLLFPIKFTSGRISWEPKIVYYAVAGIWTLFVSHFVMLSLSKHLAKRYAGSLSYARDDKGSFRNDTVLLYSLFLAPIFLGFLVSFYKPLLQYFRFIYVIPFMSILLARGASKKWQRVTLATGFLAFSLIYTYIPSFHREDWKSLAASIPSNQVCALPSSFDPLHYYRPNLKTSDSRTCKTGNETITVVPYAEAIYGFRHLEYMTENKYNLAKQVSFRGLEYQVWKK